MTAEKKTDAQLTEFIYDLLLEKFSIDFKQFELTVMSQCIEERIRQLTLNTLKDYISYIKVEKDEIDHLFAGLWPFYQKKTTSSHTQIQTALEQMTHYDNLTNLPNRRYFMQILEHATESAKQQKFPISLFYLNIDNFKKINDQLGYAIGDELLQQIVQKIKTLLRPSDFFSRLGGDEFIILCEYLTPDQTAAFAKRLCDIKQEAFSCIDHSIETSMSVGIAIMPQAGETVDSLLKSANLAMNKAKESGKNTFQFYSEEQNRLFLFKNKIERALKSALIDDELSLVYQPQIDLHTLRFLGAETLIRWENAALGPIQPSDFIPIAEESRLIYDIGFWTIKKTVENILSMKAHLDSNQVISINFSTHQLINLETIEKIESLFKKHPTLKNKIILEITETGLMQNIECAVQHMERLHQLGIGFAIDDFGTGYCSFSYLKKLPIQMIKIDQSFIQDITTDPNHGAITYGIIQMAAALGIGVIAEGVETQAQADFLREKGCKVAQGFYFCEPISFENYISTLHYRKSQS